MRLTN